MPVILLNNYNKKNQRDFKLLQIIYKFAFYKRKRKSENVCQDSNVLFYDFFMYFIYLFKELYQSIFLKLWLCALYTLNYMETRLICMLEKIIQMHCHFFHMKFYFFNPNKNKPAYLLVVTACLLVRKCCIRILIQVWMFVLCWILLWTEIPVCLTLMVQKMTLASQTNQSN